jgi:hypothetical protein
MPSRSITAHTEFEVPRSMPIARLISAPSGRGHQKVDHTIQVHEGDLQILRRLSEDGLACSPLDGHRETRRLGETGGP